MSTNEARVAVITGASAGIGASIAQRLVDDGNRVAIIGRDARRLAAARGLLGSDTVAIQADVSDLDACRTAVEEVEQAFGPVDLLINNAGVHVSGPFLESTNADYEQMLSINLFGSLNMIRAALPGMTQRGYGRIVNIASTAGKWASVNQAGYNTSKHAVVGLTRSLALEFGRSGVTINAVCPGLVDTQMARDLFESQAAAKGIPVDAAISQSLDRLSTGNLIEPEEIAGLVSYLVSDAAKNMTGQSIVLDGGRLFI